MGRMLRILAAFFLASALPAQRVAVANHWHTPFAGWHRTTVDIRPPHDAGTLPDGTRYVLGRQTGRDVWAVDLHLELDAREVRTVDLSTATESPRPAVPLPGDPLGHFGGWVACNGVPLGIVGLETDGVGWSCHVRGRTGRTFVCEAWLDWRPDEPWLVRGEALLTASNPAVPDVLETVPAGGVALTFGDGIGWGADLAAAGERFADGQARAVPVVFAWPRHAPTYEAWFLTVPAAVYRTTCAVGIRDLWSGQGNPRMQPGTDPVAWTMARYPQAQAAMRTFGAAVTGPNMNSADSGAQGDQVFVAGECKLAPGPEQVAYLSALKLAARPCHHRRADGSPLEWTDVPTVQFWHSRPHWPSTHNLLGKERGIEHVDCSGWWGPDDEHLLYNELTVAARVTGSHALQAELSQQGRLFLMSQNLPGPGHENWNTTGTLSARSIGWACLIANHLWNNLEDRGLAQQVRQRMVDRVNLVLVPQLTARGERWDTRLDDQRLGAGWWWMPEQQSIGAYGLDVVGERFGLPAARTLALAAAKVVLRDAWKLVGTRWVSAPRSPVVGTPQFDESFNYFGMSMAVATVLRHEPQNAQARAIWQQLLASASKPGDWSWLAPEITLAPPAVPSATTVTHQGVTWTFAAARPTGQFCNGDWWVVGPVTVTSIAPGRQTQPDGRVTGGSMLNPLPLASGRQGYDSQLFAPYLGDETGQPRWRPEMSLVVPATVATGSIVSTVPFFGTHPEQTSVLQTARVLTVLPAAPPAGAFRPPYAGTDKSIPATEADIDWTALASLQPATGQPDMPALLARFQGSLWLDHFPSWTSRYMHPVDGLPDYYRGFTNAIGNAALYVNSTASVAEKRPFVLALAQMGIDNHRHMQLGAVWGVNGHCNGRKFPILFAGKVLGLPALLAAGTTYAPTMTQPRGPGVVPFSEDGQTFYVQQTGSSINWGVGNYLPADIGLPEWGNFHLTGSPTDYREWTATNDYRRCCSANGWAGVTLAMRAMGLRAAWNQPAFFDYMDRYMQTEGGPGSTVWTRAWEPWQARMWDMHRGAL